MIKGIRNFIFDIGNVLLDYDPMRLLRASFESEDACRVVYDAVFRSPEWALADEGRVTDEQLIEAAILRAPQYEEEIRFAVANWHFDLPVIEGMPLLLALLREQGYGIYLLSNFSVRFHQLEGYDELFALTDGRVISADCKLVKPQRAIYELLLERYSLRAQECLFIDDVEANVRGALATGIHAHRFVGYGELLQWLAGEGLLPA